MIVLRAEPHQNPSRYPWLKLSGRWLEQAGFDPGQHVRIEAQHSRFVITPV
ncbi:SymE family type I addiction module toxin [Trinickia mobilis]|uniref:SymE family type I addiction module toxin n=1 Tax=Trinickia mobilis TaxID=2816356 RepID=UPI002867E597|nr:SymE family type I addiction module toxin [Trinickia mobilis]